MATLASPGFVGISLMADIDHLFLFYWQLGNLWKMSAQILCPFLIGLSFYRGSFLLSWWHHLLRGKLPVMS
jgi:hypothetical protein